MGEAIVYQMGGTLRFIMDDSLYTAYLCTLSCHMVNEENHSILKTLPIFEKLSSGDIPIIHGIILEILKRKVEIITK